MNSNYYSPNKEDFKISYEFEQRTDDYYDVWESRTMTEFDFNEKFFLYFEGYPFNFRVPYLIKEQIEAEGWLYKESYYEKDFTYIDKEGYYQGDVYRLYYNELIHLLTIEQLSVYEENGKPYYDLYEGNQNHIVKAIECKSINELRLIQKLLNIK